LMTKIFNHVTTRSNVFAVWCTIGFFQVTDATTQPPKLGPEISTNCGTIRRQFFCIVDRTNLTQNPTTPTQQGPQPWFLPTQTTINPGTNPNGPVTVPALSGRYDGTPFNIAAGTTLVVEPGPNQEVVTVQSVAGSSFTPAQPFARYHPLGCAISNTVPPGNP